MCTVDDERCLAVRQFCGLQAVCRLLLIVQSLLFFSFFFRFTNIRSLQRERVHLILQDLLISCEGSSSFFFEFFGGFSFWLLVLILHATYLAHSNKGPLGAFFLLLLFYFVVNRVSRPRRFPLSGIDQPAGSLPFALRPAPQPPASAPLPFRSAPGVPTPTPRSARLPQLRLGPASPHPWWKGSPEPPGSQHFASAKMSQNFGPILPPPPGSPSGPPPTGSLWNGQFLRTCSRAWAPVRAPPALGGCVRFWYWPARQRLQLVVRVPWHRPASSPRSTA